MRSLTVCTVILSLYVPTAAQKLLRAKDIPTSADASVAASKFQDLRVGKLQVRKRVRKLHKELDWHRSLDKALAAAKKSGKPVVWIHALGKLTGYV